MNTDKLIQSNEKALRAWSELSKGREHGLFELYDLYSPQLLAFGKKRANKDVAKDALQETFAALWSSRLRLGKTDSPKNYLFATYRRKLVGMLDEQKKYVDVDQADIDLPATDTLDDESSIKIQPLLEQLSSNQKEIIYLKYYQGMDYDEIAEILDMNYQSARNLMSRAIKSIRSKISLFLF